MKTYDCDVVLVFLCGEPLTLAGNLAIIKRADEIGSLQGKPTMGHVKESERVRREGGYLSTLKFVRIFATEARKNNWKKVLVVAAPFHAPRCVRDLKKYGFQAEADDSFKGQEELFFSPSSKQWWTRFPLVCVLREFILRSLPWWLYQKITG